MREAIFVASPDLHASLGALEEQTARSVYRYAARMCSRATPFGLFASVGLGRLGERTDLRVGDPDELDRKTRIDNDYLFQLCAHLRALPQIARSLRYRPSTSLCMHAGCARYVEARASAGGGHAYHLVTTPATVPLRVALDRARSGASYDELCQSVAEATDVDLDKASGFVDDLIDAQLLVSDLQPVVTGQEPMRALIEDLGSIEAATETASVLAGVDESLTALDREGVGATSPDGEREPYQRVIESLSALAVPPDVRRTFQVDLIDRSQGLTLHRRVAKDIARAVDMLASVTPRPTTALHRFRDAFAARYETAPVPLLVALDEESGIGFDVQHSHRGDSSPLLTGLRFDARRNPREVRWMDRENNLLRLLARAERDDAAAVELTDSDIAALQADPPVQLPASMAAVATVCAASPKAVDEGEYRLVFHGAHENGMRVLGRFCHASSEIEAAVRQQLAAEDLRRPHAIHAEIVHLPAGRTGNVVCRPILRDHEISYLGRSGASNGAVIRPDDLWLRMQGRRLVLWSKRLNREVVPCMTNAHAPGSGLGVYQLLAGLAHQDRGGVSWSWGPVSSAERLPRVTWGRLVLSRASWNLQRNRLEPLRDAGALQRLRDDLKLPRLVLLAERDRELLIDLDNPLACETFARLVRSREKCRLVEFLPANEELVVRGPEGDHTHELVVLLNAETPPPPKRPPPPAVSPNPSAVRRSFPPGSEWLYLRIAAGPAAVDRVLGEGIEPLLPGGPLAHHPFFFLRYADPDWHLRLRVKGDADHLLREVAPTILESLEPLRADGTIRAIELATYEREVERYGGPAGIELAEQIACVDSAACLEMLLASTPETLADARWRLALVGVDRLLTDFDVDLDARIELVTSARDALGQEFGMDRQLRRKLGDRDRELRADLEPLLRSEIATEHPLGPGLAALAARSVRLRPLASSLIECARTGRLTRPLFPILLSIMHLHINRVLRSSQLAQELVIYHLLGRYYRSAKARGHQ